jgi:ATP-binding cassette subfamily C exporter for protease/lipase
MQIVLPQQQKQALSELRRAFEAQRPELIRAFWFSMVTGLMALAPTIYMFEVYGRVVDARSLSTLAWMTLLVVLAYRIERWWAARPGA